MKLQTINHTTHNIIKGVIVLMLYFLCTLSCYSNDKLLQLEVKQRKGNMLVKLHNYSDTTSLVCVIQGSGNNLVADFDPEKVLKVSGTLLNRGAVTISSARKKPTKSLHSVTPPSIWKMPHLTCLRSRCQEWSVLSNPPFPTAWDYPRSCLSKFFWKSACYL